MSSVCSATPWMPLRSASSRACSILSPAKEKSPAAEQKDENDDYQQGVGIHAMDASTREAIARRLQLQRYPPPRAS